MRSAGFPTGWLAVLLALLVTAEAVQAQSWRTVSRSRQAAGVEDLDVTVKYAAGRFSIRPAEPGLLYRMDLTYDEDHFEPLSRLEGNELVLGIDGRRSNIDLDGDDESSFDLELSRDVTMDLVLEFGAVKADLDLGGLSLRNLKLSTGASDSQIRVSEPNPVAMDEAEIEVGAASFEMSGLGNLNARRISVDAGVGNVELDFSGEWLRDAAVSVDMGLGALRLSLPTDVGIRLEKDTFLTSLDADGLVKQGDAYVSNNWESAKRKITIEVDAAFGSIDVDWLR